MSSPLADTTMLDLLPELARRLAETPIPPPPSVRQQQLQSELDLLLSDRRKHQQFHRWVEAYQPLAPPLIPSVNRIQLYSAPEPPPLAPVSYRSLDWQSQYPQRFQPGVASVRGRVVDFRQVSPSLIPGSLFEIRIERPWHQRLREGLARDWAVIRAAMSAAMSRDAIPRGFSLPAVGVTSTARHVD